MKISIFVLLKIGRHPIIITVIQELIIRKELGKWLMDIAKYITTAVVLTSIFGEVEQKWIIYAGGMISVALALGWGLYLVRDKKKGE